jgi:hypothetical protein
LGVPSVNIAGGPGVGVRYLRDSMDQEVDKLEADLQKRTVDILTKAFTGV